MYVEFIERDRSLPLEVFRFHGSQASWSDPDDVLFACLGRTMRLGFHPSYLTFWKCKGMSRLDEWETHFRSDAGLRDVYENATAQAIHIVEGGCYDILTEKASPRQEALHYLESFDIDASDVAAFSEGIVAREKANGGAELTLLVQRIGLLGPLQFGSHIALWTLADYEALEDFIREQRPAAAARPVGAGVYRTFGHEIM